jgi:alpha-L-rhamnosidase
MYKIQLLKGKIAASLVCLTLFLFDIPASSQITVTGTNQVGSVPLTPTWTAASGNLIAGLAPTTANGDFGEYTGANANNLTRPGIALTAYAYSSPQATNLEVCGDDGTAGALLVYTLPASTFGYNLTNITVYGGWQDNGRDAQDYTVYYSTVTNPSDFMFLASVSYIPSNPSAIGDATRVVINDSAGAAIANNVAALKFDFTIPDGGSRENSAAAYTAITVAGAVATNIVAEGTNGPPPIFGSSPIAEPYPYVSSGSFSGSAVPLSPDPLVAYRWPNPQATDGLQIYLQKPVTVTADTNSSFANLQSLTGNNPDVTVNGTGSIQMDFGRENAAWLEFDSTDLTGTVEMSIGEYNEPEEVQSVPKTAVPIKYGNTYRLELNSQLYEGVRFGWIHVMSYTSPWHITGIRIVCQNKPANYNGSFSCSDPMLTRIWYTGAYTVKLNLLDSYFGAVLVDRGDRIAWTGDDHCAQAAALVAFGNDDFTKENITSTANNYNGIASYALYWVLSLIDYYNYTGDTATLGAYISTAQSVLDNAYAVYGTNPSLGFYGWDERLGAGFENANCQECENAYKMLSIQTWAAFAAAMGAYGRTDLQAEYNGYANAKIAALRQNAAWVQGFGLHACADAVNTGLLNNNEENAIFAQEFTNRVNRISYSPFNQYFVIQAFAAMDKFDDALSSIRDLWGSEINYGGTTFFEVSHPSWNNGIGTNDPVPNAQNGSTSLCHPWSAGVIKWLSEEVLGIKPTAPGFTTYQILPHLGRTLTYVSGQTPTPSGTIQASFNVSNGLCTVSAPAGTMGTVGIPKVEQTINSITINGTLAWDGVFHPVAGISGASNDTEFVYFTGVQPGTYSMSVSYGGSTPVYNEPPEQYAAQFITADSTTSGNWGGVYGKDGYVLCNYNGNDNDQKSLPTYVSSVTYYGTTANGTVWASGTNDDRALAPNSSNQNPRNATCLYANPTMTFTINGTGIKNYQVALYFVDWDNKGRRLAVEMFDANTLNLIAPVEVITNFTGGEYLVYTYNQSAKFRIDQVRGDNAVLSGIFFDSAPTTPFNLNNNSFEFDLASPGAAVSTVPTGWTAFNEGGASDIGSQNAGGTDYTVYDPLAAPAAGNQYCYINMFNPGVTGGIYQDVGALQPNTTYTLTVAIGSRKDRTNSLGIISFINGTNNTGTVLASGGGPPGTQNSWQNYTATFTTGVSVSGDLTIALSVAGNATTIQADFDNVQLAATPIVLQTPTLGAPKVSGGNLILTGTGGTPNAGYTWLVTTNLSAPINWMTNSTGLLDGMGAFSNPIPINPLQPVGFFRLQMP